MPGKAEHGAPTAALQEERLSHARLMLLASGCASKLQLVYVQGLMNSDGGGGGSGKRRKWTHVFRALCQDRASIFPSTGAATATTMTLKASPNQRNRSIRNGHNNEHKSGNSSDSSLAHSPLLKSAHAKACPARIALLRNLSSILLRHLDRDGDGRVGRDEFMAGWTAAAADVFGTRLDPYACSQQKREDGVIACSIM